MGHLCPAGHERVNLQNSTLRKTMEKVFRILLQINIYITRFIKSLLCSIAHSIICTLLFHGKMHSEWFNGIEILQGRWQHGEKVGYCYPSGLEKTLCKWDIYVPLVTKGLKRNSCESVSK